MFFTRLFSNPAETVCPLSTRHGAGVTEESGRAGWLRLVFSSWFPGPQGRGQPSGATWWQEAQRRESPRPRAPPGRGARPRAVGPGAAAQRAEARPHPGTRQRRDKSRTDGPLTLPGESPPEPPREGELGPGPERLSKGSLQGPAFPAPARAHLQSLEKVEVEKGVVLPQDS